MRPGATHKTESFRKSIDSAELRGDGLSGGDRYCDRHAGGIDKKHLGMDAGRGHRRDARPQRAAMALVAVQWLGLCRGNLCRLKHRDALRNRSDGRMVWCRQLARIRLCASHLGGEHCRVPGWFAADAAYLDGDPANLLYARATLWILEAGQSVER